MDDLTNGDDIIIFLNVVADYAEVFILVFSTVLFCVLINLFFKYRVKEKKNRLLNICAYFLIIFFILHNLLRLVYYGDYLDVTDVTIEFFEITMINIYNLIYSSLLGLIILSQKKNQEKVSIV